MGVLLLFTLKQKILIEVFQNLAHLVPKQSYKL